MRNNVRKRFDLIAEELLRLSPDIVTLQEVYLFHTFRHLKKLLRDYPYVGYQRMFFGPRGGIVIFSKIPLEKTEYIDFKDRGQYTNKAITGQLTRKGVLLTKIKDLPLWILTTHLIQNSDYPWIENIWNEQNKFSGLIQSQLDQTASIVQTLTKTDMNVIITGDFNIPKRTNFYRHFIKDAGVIDTFAKFNQPTYHKAFIPETAQAERLDYIFYNSKGGVLKSSDQKHILENPVVVKTEEIYLSDHVGLMTTFTIEN